jgi:hypothetical protein
MSREARYLGHGGAENPRGKSGGDEAPGVRVDVHGTLPKKADEGLPGPFAKIDGEAAGSGDARDDRNLGSEGFLGELEGSATADEKNSIGEGKAVVEDGVAEDFVESVVTPDIFAKNNEFALPIEETAGVESACFFKGLLRGAHFTGERKQDRTGKGKVVLIDRGEGLKDGFDGGFAADAAA